MLRQGSQDFYLFEPMKLDDGRVVLPTRWFFRTASEGVRRYFAEACRLEAVMSEGCPRGYVAHEYERFVIDARNLMFSFPKLVDTFLLDNLPDPRAMLGPFVCYELCHCPI